MGDQRQMMRTRAELIGVKPKVLAARTKRRLKSIRARIEGLGAAFDEVDNSVTFEAQALLGAFDEFEKTVNQSVDWLNEAAEYQ